MAVNYDGTVKNARMTATRDQFANGTLEILSAADAVLAVFTLNASGGTVATNAWTLGFTSSSTTGTAAAGAGTTATKAQLKTSGGVARLTGLVVGSDVTLSNASIANGQTVSVTSAVITHAT